jgi:DNA-binding transcriptional LysR family regulator
MRHFVIISIGCVGYGASSRARLLTNADTMGTELRHLQYFAAVAEDLNFSTAARRLYVSQQALSRTVQQLERQIGAKLLDRTTRSVTLTAAGAAMLPAARRAIAAADDAVAQARRAARGEPLRRLRIDISSWGLETGALILRRLRRDHPDLPVDQVEEGVPRGLVSLEEGRLDALLGLATHRRPHVPSDVVRHEAILVGMAKHHSFAALNEVPVANLGDVELLLPSAALAPEWIHFVERFCGQADVKPRRWPGTTHGSIAAADVLREHDCVVPTVAWAEPPDDIVFRPLVHPRPVFTWSLMTAPDAQGRPELEALRTCIRALRSERAWLESSQTTPPNLTGALAVPSASV